MRYFFDTYAFFEIIEGNPSYNKYSEHVAIVTTKLQLMELYYGLLKLYGKHEAEFMYDRFVGSAVEISNEEIKAAMDFRHRHSKKKFSYIDCTGYVSAQRRGIMFLTGDKAFDGIPGVEFVK